MICNAACSRFHLLELAERQVMKPIWPGMPLGAPAQRNALLRPRDGRDCTQLPKEKAAEAALALRM
jgi:hypothetical protein